MPIDDTQSPLREPERAARKVTEPKPTSFHIGYGVYLNKPKPDLGECMDVCRRILEPLEVKALGHERGGYPASDRDTLVFEIAALARVIKMLESIAPCEQAVMQTILAARRGRTPGDE